MPRIPEETIQEVIAANLIDDVVGQYVELRPDGRNKKALCPFHREKTPSFKVHPEKQIYRCFGCGVSGNVISFVMAVERVDFLTAIKMLAERAGITLKHADSLPASQVELARRANELACQFYERQLNADGFGVHAKTYLQKRGFDQEIIKLFRIGAAPPEWDALNAFLRRQRIPQEPMLLSGLVAQRKSGQGVYDYFRERLLFPILDARGQVVGFGARSLTDQGPKYLNTPETRFFHKGRLLYGLHLAADYLRRERQVIIMEGYTDVMMAVQAGMEGVVACLGTAFTKDNAQTIKRYADKAILVYDGDAAGMSAAERALGPLWSQGLEVRIVLLPDGLDPCDFLIQRGADAFKQCIKHGTDGVAFLAKRAHEKSAGQAPAAARSAILQAMAPLHDVSDPLMREMITQRLAGEFGLDPFLLKKQAPKAMHTREESVRKEPVSDYPSAEETLLAALIAEPSLRDSLPMPQELLDPMLQEIRKTILAHPPGEGMISRLQAHCADTPLEKRLMTILNHIEDVQRMMGRSEWRSVAENSLRDLQRRMGRQEENRLRQAMQSARERGDRDGYKKLLIQYQAVLRHVKLNSLEQQFSGRLFTAGPMVE